MTLQTLFTSWAPYSSWEHLGQSKLVVYLSMEIAITPAMPTYSGGLGVLAGDTLRAAADMGLPLVAVTLAHRKGYRANPLAGVPYTTNLQSFPCAAQGETHSFYEHLEQSVA
jgi:hypothetical protein